MSSLTQSQNIWKAATVNLHCLRFECVVWWAALRSSGTSSAVAKCPRSTTSSAATILPLSIIRVTRRSLLQIQQRPASLLRLPVSAHVHAHNYRGERDKRIKKKQRLLGWIAHRVTEAINHNTDFVLVCVQQLVREKERMSETGTYSSGRRSMLVAMQRSLLEAIFLI